jgi:transcriptional activator SPT7
MSFHQPQPRISDHHPRKRARFGSQEKDAVELWWDAMQSDYMIGSGLPVLKYSASEALSRAEPPNEIVDPPRKASQRPRKKRRKQDSEPLQKTLLYHMNNNVRTLRRVRDMHESLSLLKELGEDASGSGPGQPIIVPPPPVQTEDVVDDRPWRARDSGIDIGETEADDCLHWAGSKMLEHVGFQGKYCV